MHILGIDVGGTKTAICLGTEEGRILASSRIAMSSAESADAFFPILRRHCDEVFSKSGIGREEVTAVGISAPGPLNSREGVLLAPPNNPGWINVPIVSKLHEIIGKPVFLNNDANAAALAEYLFGEYRGTENLVYLTFSTGMGGGIIAAGRLVQGVTDMGGEVGHQTLDSDGPLCGCGKRGCFEAYVGGRMVVERLRRRIREENIKTSILDKVDGDIERVDHKSFVAAAREGDPFALSEWDRMVERLAQGIGNIIMMLNPEVIVLGTIAVHEGDFVLTPLKERLPKYTWKWCMDACKIVPSALGPAIGNLAAVAVALHGINQPQS